MNPKYILTRGRWILGDHGIWERRGFCARPRVFHSKTAARKYRKRTGHARAGVEPL
jgi:hypothetical protein